MTNKALLKNMESNVFIVSKSPISHSVRNDKKKKKGRKSNFYSFFFSLNIKKSSLWVKIPQDINGNFFFFILLLYSFLNLSSFIFFMHGKYHPLFHSNQSNAFRTGLSTE